MAAAAHETDWDATAHRHTLAERIASLPHTLLVDRGSDCRAPQIDAFLSQPVPRSIRGRTETRLFCSLSADGMLIVGLDMATRCELIARGCGEAAPGGVLMRIPSDDDELDACWAIVQQAHHSLSADNGTASSSRVPMLPNFSRTRLQ